MLRHQRRVLNNCLGIGIALTLLTIAADVAGLLRPLEDWLYDSRAQSCQFFNKPPTDTLVHLDLDDNALEVIGRWPWPRARVAQMLDEIRLAGPKAVELDVLLSESEEIEYVPRDPSAATTAPTTRYASPTTAPVECVPFDNDVELAKSVSRLGNVILPALLESIPKESPRFRLMVEEFRKDLELQEPDLVARMTARGEHVGPEGLGERFFMARREAIKQDFIAMRPGPEMTFAQVRARLLPKTPPEVNSGPVNVLREQWTKYLDDKSFEQFSLPRPPGMTSYSTLRIQLAPIHVLSEAAAGGAFANHMAFGSPVVRSLPILLEREGRVYPQMGLALAARMLDADLTKMRVERGRLHVPRKTGDEIVIPLAPPQSTMDGVVHGNLIDIPWFGPRRWEFMYDRNHEGVNKQHMPLHDVWQACEARRKLQHNIHRMDEAIGGVYWGMDTDDRRAKAYIAAAVSPDDLAQREKIAHQLIDEEFAGYLEGFAKYTPADIAALDEKQRRFFESLKALDNLRKLNPVIVQELNGYRSHLAELLKDKAVLLGWTATAAIADFVPTSIHEKAPGAVVHGVIYNGIMTGEMWSRPPWWVGDLFAGVMGLLTALAVGYFSPIRGLALAAALVACYALLNGVILFDYGNKIVTTAAPLATVAVVWGMCTLTRIRVEQVERDRITSRFSSYADSRLVDYVLESEQTTFEGEDREVTVVFTDLAGFTSLSEKLGPKIVPMLNELFDDLVPVIREHHSGYINKFIGDGIMFFYNAPRHHELHASEAVSTVLDMHVKLAEFNKRLLERGLPSLGMRAGIASGVVVVGDAGGGGRSDYTCLGDAVNLSSRLEAANKQVGTSTLMNDRSQQLLNGEYLLRPVGRIRVVGKDEAVMCYEPLARSKDATDEQRGLAAKTAEMVEAFMARKFEESFRCADEIDAKFGQSKLTMIYRSMSAQYLESSPPDDFDGRIVLTEK